jgi:hypothetical protein
VASRAWSSAPTAAEPITPPSWRLVLIRPDAAPATWGAMSRIAIV